MSSSPAGKKLKTMSDEQDTECDNTDATDSSTSNVSSRSINQIGWQERVAAHSSGMLPCMPEYSSNAQFYEGSDSESTGLSDPLTIQSVNDDQYIVSDVDDSSDSDSSSGYIGYDNVVAARYFYDDEESLDAESDTYNQANDHYSPGEYLKYDPTPDNPYPKPDWFTLATLRARMCGFASAKNFGKRQAAYWCERYASNSLWTIQRLQRTRELEGHSGCVNSLDFSSSARFLCSGGDDLDICIWDWRKGDSQHRCETNSGHTSNIFQTQFCQKDTCIVTASRDGSCRSLDIVSKVNRRLLATSGEIHKLTFIDEQTFLSCNTNGLIHQVDMRTKGPTKLFNARISLHCIDSHPLDKHMIAVAGKSPFVSVYDLRRLPRDPELKPIYKLGNIDNQDVCVTSTAYNPKGDKLLVSYNDDDLYAYRTDTCEVIHRYKGHRNRKTYKNCAWFGDNFVISGSDDGHIYGWDLESEHIVCFLLGEQGGIVNTLLVHPTLPVLASSGLEFSIKIWEPVADTWPQTMRHIKPQICKNTLRRKMARLRPRMLIAAARRTGPDVDLDEYMEDDDDDDDEDDDVEL